MSASLRQRLVRHPALKVALHPWITLGGLLLLLLLVFFGTLYQADHGLYEAQRLFFGYSLVRLGGWVPVPGASLVLWVLSLQLTLTMLFVHQLAWKKFGLWVVHSGIMLLLVGGFITQTLSVESQLTLAEGETGHFTTAYHEWEIAIWKTRGDTSDVLAYADGDLRPGAVLDLSPYPARLTVREYHENAEAFTDRATGKQTPFLNASGIAGLGARKSEKEASENAPGLIASLLESGKTERQILLSGLEMRPLALKIGGERVFCQLRRRHYPLPFALKLSEFIRTLHPGTDIASSYESQAEIQDGLSSRPVRIWMNNPLRYAGYTLFQASFSEDEKGIEHSTFAAVTNPGRLLPYISSLAVFGGMLLHFLIRFLAYARRTAPV